MLTLAKAFVPRLIEKEMPKPQPEALRISEIVGMASEIMASQKCSITLYQRDLDILDKIREYLRQKGVRNLSDSEGLRLACRTLSFDDRLLRTYESMKMEDGRRRR